MGNICYEEYSYKKEASGSSNTVREENKEFVNPLSLLSHEKFSPLLPPIREFSIHTPLYKGKRKIIPSKEERKRVQASTDFSKHLKQRTIKSKGEIQSVPLGGTAKHGIDIRRFIEGELCDKSSESFVKKSVDTKEGLRTPPSAATVGICRKATHKFNPTPSQFRCENTHPCEDRYERLEIIGKGAYGEVSKIEDKTTKEIRALKKIEKSKCHTEKQFSEEIRILQTIDHPNLLRFYEYYQDENFYYLVTDYCKGGDLLSKLTELRRFPEEKAALIMKQILVAVEYCHNSNIIHRDLKAENIVFQGSIDTPLKIIDFGRSKIIKEKEKIREKAGSLYYIAPEVLQEKEYNTKCDIWSCGVILYLMIVGEPPFYGRTKEETINKILAGKVDFENPIWRKTTKECKSLIQKMLVINQEQRISAKRALTHKFFEKHKRIMEEQKEELIVALNNLRNFRTQMLFQKAVLTYVASQQLTQKEEQKIRLLFDHLDKDKDGKLNKKELTDGYDVVYKDHKRAKKEANKILKNIDLNNNGTVEYNEFLVANLQLSSALKDTNLKEAFDFYDADKNGEITFDELKAKFGALCNDHTIKQIIDEADTNNDNQISFDEFKKMMEIYKIHSCFSHERRSMSD